MDSAQRPTAAEARQEMPVPTGEGLAAAIRAAGCVLWRPRHDRGGIPDGAESAADAIEVALVHRPRYDDWSLPKGKLDPGELPQHAAVREVGEETGFRCELSRFLLRLAYTVPERDLRATKAVDYYAARAVGGNFVPNDEVDELRWVSPARGREMLSYAPDAQVLDAFERLPADTATVLLVRHAKAGSRAEWAGDDSMRPLSSAGMRQRTGLHSLLPLFGPERLYSAPRVRCEQTIAPVAADLGIGIAGEPVFSEENYRTNPAAAVDRVLHIAGGAGTALVCSQGGVIPDLVTRLAELSGLPVGEVRSKKGSVWALTFARDTAVNGSGPGLRLVAADYTAEALTDADDEAAD